MRLQYSLLVIHYNLRPNAKIQRLVEVDTLLVEGAVHAQWVSIAE